MKNNISLKKRFLSLVTAGVLGFSYVPTFAEGIATPTDLEPEFTESQSVTIEVLEETPIVEETVEEITPEEQPIVETQPEEESPVVEETVEDTTPEEEQSIVEGTEQNPEAIGTPAPYIPIEEPTVRPTFGPTPKPTVEPTVEQIEFNVGVEFSQRTTDFTVSLPSKSDFKMCQGTVLSNCGGVYRYSVMGKQISFTGYWPLSDQTIDLTLFDQNDIEYIIHINLIYKIIEIQATEVPSSTGSPVPTSTPAPTGTPTSVPTSTPGPSEDPVSPILTELPISTHEPLPTSVPTSTPVPTATPTSVPTSTPVPTATPTSVPTSTPEPTATPTSVPTSTPVSTATPTSVPTSTPEPTATPTSVPTSTPVPTATPTSVPTSTPVPTPYVTVVPTVSPVVTIEPTKTPRPTARPTSTPVPTVAPVYGSYEGTNDVIGEDFVAENKVIDRTKCETIMYVAHFTFDNRIIVYVQEDLTKSEMFAFDVWYRALLNLDFSYKIEFVNVSLDELKYNFDLIRKFRNTDLMTHELHYGYYDKELMNRINNVKNRVKMIIKKD